MNESSFQIDQGNAADEKVLEKQEYDNDSKEDTYLVFYRAPISICHQQEIDQTTIEEYDRLPIT